MKRDDEIYQLAMKLTEASYAHHAFEIAQAKPDPEWAAWYAEWIVDHGYRLERRPSDKMRHSQSESIVSFILSGAALLGLLIYWIVVKH